MADDNPLGSVPGMASEGAPNLPPISTPAPKLAPQQPPQANPQQAANEADVQHHSLLGKAFRSLMGNEVSYQVDPQSGKMVTSQAEQKPGSLWRGILAGALLGGATAQKAKADSFGGGAVTGAAGVIDDKRQQDLIKRGQARQEFEDNLKAQANQRADKVATTQEEMMRAQIAMHNAHTLHENQLMQREDFDFHQKVAESGKVQLQPFKDAGVPIPFDNIPESQMNELIQNNPEVTKYLWEPTGTRVVIGANGKPDHEMTYSAVDPKGKVKITDSQLKQWREAGLDQWYGKSWDVLKKDKELDASQYMALTQKEQELTNKKLIREKQSLELEKDKSTIDLSKANVAHLKAETSKLYSDMADKKLLDESWELLSKTGDVSKLNGKQQSVISKAVVDVMGGIERQIHELPKDTITGQPTDQERAKQLYQGWDGYKHILDKLYGVKAAEPSVGAAKESQKASDAVQNISELMAQDKIQVGGVDAFEYINKSSGISEADKAAAVKKFALVPWYKIVERAEQEGITKKKMSEKFKAQGFKVQDDPSEDMTLLPVGAG